MTGTDLFVLATLLAAAGLLFLPRLARAPLWRAGITPLASIIGSGFLVLGPILTVSYGAGAPVVMGLLCLGAWMLGGAVRHNIRRIASGSRGTGEERLDHAAGWVLAFAYVISVAYYLNLFGAFALEKTPFSGEVARRGLTTAVFLVILATGWFRGFSALERMEQIAVTTKLAVIAGLIAGMAVFFAARASYGALIVERGDLGGWPAITLAFGLIVTVQGFETSRYLGSEYDPETRIRSMRLAQLAASAIYLIYILLLAYVFRRDEIPMSETGIIALMEQVAPVLPALLILAALMAQFSAAVADTGGAGGLAADLSGGRLTPRMGYAILTGLGVALTWMADVYEIIAYASRAFALYYAMQAMIAALGSRTSPRVMIWYASLSVAAVAMALFGTPAEGG